MTGAAVAAADSSSNSNSNNVTSSDCWHCSLVSYQVSQAPEEF